MSVTVQRFHAVLELKNELAQLAAGMPLFPQHMRGPPPDHDDSLDTSHVHSSQHMSLILPQLNEQQLMGGTHQQSRETTSMSGTSFFTEQGGGWRDGEKEGGREREREERPEEERERREEEEDHHCHTEKPTIHPEQLHSTHNKQGGQNPLHSKSKIVLMSHHHHHSDSISRPTNATSELQDIAENKAEFSPTPAQQPGHSEPGRGGREESDHEDNERVLAGDGDEHMSNSSRTMSVHKGQYYSPASATPELESGELEHAGQELEGEEVESNTSQGETNIVWNIGEHN